MPRFIPTTVSISAFVGAFGALTGRLVLVKKEEPVLVLISIL